MKTFGIVPRCFSSLEPAALPGPQQHRTCCAAQLSACSLPAVVDFSGALFHAVATVHCKAVRVISALS